jgi:hypothetical protein
MRQSLEQARKGGLIARNPAVDATPPAARQTTGRRPLIDLPTVAKYLGVTERHVGRPVLERRIPYIEWGHLLPLQP